MDKNISKLNPQLLWKHFAAICAIPHPSYHEEGIRAYLVSQAKALGVACEVDQAGNVMMHKAATPGMENRKGIILQSHTDMVPQKNGDKTFDFEKDSIEAYIDGEWVTANGTTLGADNGIGMAAILAAMEDKALKHGPLEGLFTATEETGMVGAFGLSAGKLQGEILLNLDSETEGELCVGCAGGLDANVTFPYKEVGVPADHRSFRVDVKGLKGGHSGIEIILERGNANKIMCRLLLQASQQCGLRLASIDGGGLRNAIPREATATVVVPVSQVAAFVNAVAAYQAVVKTELAGVDDAVTVAVSETQTPSTLLDAEAQMRLLHAVEGCPNGVMRMSPSMQGVVHTSTNLARVVSEKGEVKMQSLLRSSSNSEKEDLGQMITSVFALSGATTVLSGEYNGWNPNMQSPILKTMVEAYKKLYGNEPEIKAIHAGLECGILAGAYPNWDMISFGPTICHPHSPDEKVNIASVGKFWDYLVYTLANAPKR